MKQMIFTAVALLGIGSGVSAQSVEPDTITLQNVEVSATRATRTEPITFTTVTSDQLRAVNHGLDLPFLLSTTPGVLVTSDAGAGVGYTSIRIRGTDATRINVTANDIPMNDAESHSIFWVNTPDMASSVADMQVQRGVGTSTNGTGAFGGSINIRTQTFARDPYAEVSGSYGSYNTHKETVKAGTGLLADHWAADVRLSHVASDGYRDRATSSLKGYYAQLGYFGGGTSVRFITFGGKEDTYHAWDGISREMLTTNRRYNPNGEIKRDGKVVGFYDDQKDIYRQTHYQLIWNQRFAHSWKLKLAAHYTDGYGYYQEYKNARTLKEYGLTPFATPEGMVKKSSLVRRKILDADFGGAVFAVNYGGDRLQATFGGGYNYYTNNHHGRVVWVENYIGTLAPDHEYYRNKGSKHDFDIYLKGDYRIAGGLSAYADMQYRYIKYVIKGVNDKWDWTATPERMQELDVDEDFHFFNPKVGLNYTFARFHRVYGSMAIAHKEPTRNNYNDGPLTVHPRSERLIDWELGYGYRTERFAASCNLYYMLYHDQLVLNGKLNEIGELMMENVPDSYRTGIELAASWQPLPWLRWDVNCAFSRNKIKNYVGYVSDYDADWNELWTQTAISNGSSTIAFSPSIVGNNIFTVDYKGFTASLQSQWVSRQYLDNFGRKTDSLDPFFVNHLSLAYSFRLPHVKSITAGVTIYNLFNTKYETNGYSQTAAVWEHADKTGTMTLVSDPRFYPMAGTNVLGHITLSF